MSNFLDDPTTWVELGRMDPILEEVSNAKSSEIRFSDKSMLDSN